MICQHISQSIFHNIYFFDIFIKVIYFIIIIMEMVKVDLFLLYY